MFVPQTRKHCESVGLPSNCIIILTLDNCSAHPPAATLIRGNIRVMYLPPNVTSIFQPMDQGIIRSLKCKYRQIFLQRMIDSRRKIVLVLQFPKVSHLKILLGLRSSVGLSCQRYVNKRMEKNVATRFV